MFMLLYLNRIMFPFVLENIADTPGFFCRKDYNKVQGKSMF